MQWIMNYECSETVYKIVFFCCVFTILCFCKDLCTFAHEITFVFLLNFFVYAITKVSRHNNAENEQMNEPE